MMKGLLTKELIVFLKNNKFQLGLILLFAVSGILLKNTMYVMLTPLLLSLLIKQGLTMDEMCKWDKFSVCLPIEKKNVVSSKYIMLLIASVFSLLVILAAFSLMVLFGSSGVSASDIPVYFGLTAVESLLLPAVMFPFDFKFGSVKGRVIYMIVTALAVSFIASTAITDGGEFLKKLPSPAALTVICIAASAAAFAASWFISAKIYEAKEI